VRIPFFFLTTHIHVPSIRSSAKSLLETRRPPRLSTTLRRHTVRAFHPPDSAFGRRYRSRVSETFFPILFLLTHPPHPRLRFRFHSDAVRFYSSRLFIHPHPIPQDCSATRYRCRCNCHLPAPAATAAATWSHRGDRCYQHSPQSILYVVTSANSTDALQALDSRTCSRRAS
jgi:hypothetical protein